MFILHKPKTGQSPNFTSYWRRLYQVIKEMKEQECEFRETVQFERSHEEVTQRNDEAADLDDQQSDSENRKEVEKDIIYLKCEKDSQLSRSGSVSS